MRERFGGENRKWLTLAAVAFGLFMIMLDNTVVNVALPSIRKSLNVGISELEWTVNAYALTFGVLLLAGGRLADMFGRRRLFISGLVVFTVSSLACGMADTSTFLIAARTVQGVGAAMMNPATLSIITATFAPKERGTAIGIWAGISALALAIGPLLGGYLTETIAWEAIFFINIPIGIIGIFMARLFIDESRSDEENLRLDLPGLITSGIALFALMFALIETNDYAWGSTRVLSLLILSAVMFGVFILLELRQRYPMLDLNLFKNKNFTGANTVMLLVGLTMFGIFFFNSLFLQNVLGYSAIETGAAFLPMTLLIILIAPIAGRLSDQIGSRWLMTIGMLLLAISMMIFGRLEANSSFYELLPGLILGGIGMAITMTPTTATAMRSVPVNKAGVGSAVLNSMRQVGGSLGIAMMGTIVASQVKVTSANPAYNDQFITGFHNAVHVGGALCIFGAVIAAVMIKPIRPRRVREPEPAKSLQVQQQ